MNRIAILSFALAVSACTVSTGPGPAYPQQQPPPPHEPGQPPPPATQPAPPPPPPQAPTPSGFSSRGHTMITEANPDPRRGVLAFPVTSDATPQRIVLVVEDGDIFVDDVVVTYTTGARADTGARQAFNNAGRVKIIDILGNRNPIKHVEVRYRDVAGRPRVQLWFANKAPGPEPAQWDRGGYAMLGEGKIDPAKKSITFTSSERAAAPQKLMVVVEGGDIDITNIAIQHGDPSQGAALGPKVDRQVAGRFTNGARNREIDLRGNRYPVRAFEVFYHTVAGRPVVQIWAAGMVGAAPAPAPTQAGWDKTGWKKLTQNPFTLNRTSLNLPTKNSPPAPQKLMLVVDDGDVAVDEVIVYYTRSGKPGDSVSTRVGQTFNGNNHNIAVDLSGNRRPVDYIEIRYKNTAGHPTVQVWAPEN